MSSEFEFIGRLKELFKEVGSEPIERIGDDCAVLPYGEGEFLVMTTDLLSEGIHFLREAISPEELGAKALSVNLSDVAAMGAKPIATLLSIGLPADCVGEWANRFAEGYRELSAKHDVALIGGDTTASKNGVVASVTAIGKVSRLGIKRRSGAQIGDRILVAGMLGDSAAGLRDVLAGVYDSELAQIHHRPRAQVEEGKWFALRDEVHSMIDLSDGLASDLVHILMASEVGANVNVEAIPTRQSLEEALCGGEDFILLLTAEKDKTVGLCCDFETRFGTKLYDIGEITAENIGKITWTRDGEVRQDDWRGFTHF